MRLSISDQ